MLRGMLAVCPGAVPTTPSRPWLMSQARPWWRASSGGSCGGVASAKNSPNSPPTARKTVCGAFMRAGLAGRMPTRRRGTRRLELAAQHGELLGEVLHLEREPRQPDRVVEADREQEQLAEEEQRRARRPGADDARQPAEERRHQRERGDAERDAHPDRRVLLA